MGLVRGVCNACGKTLCRSNPVLMIVACDCYKHCPLCGAEMKPYAPDLSPRTYRSKDSSEWDLTGSTSKNGDSARTLHVCYNHDPPYYSSLLPMEVRLE